MKKIGMPREGLLREHWFYKGSFHDSVIYSILAKEYAGEQLQRNTKKLTSQIWSTPAFFTP